MAGWAAGVPVGGTLEVLGTVKGQPVRAVALRLGEHDFEVLPRAPVSESQEMREVAGLLNRMVHHVAFELAKAEVGMAVAGLEDFQRECWDRERDKEDAACARGKTNKACGAISPKRGKGKAARKAPAQDPGSRRPEGRRSRAPKEPRDPKGAGEGPWPLDETLMMAPHLSLHRSHPQRGFEALPGLLPSGRRSTEFTSPPVRETAASQFAPLLPPSFLLEAGSEAFVRRLNELQSLCIESARNERRALRPMAETPAARHPAAPVAAGPDSDEDEVLGPNDARIPMDIDILAGCSKLPDEVLSSDKDTDESSEKPSDDDAPKAI